MIETFCNVCAIVRINFSKVFLCIFLDSIDIAITSQFICIKNSLFESISCISFYCFFNFCRDISKYKSTFRFADFSNNLLLEAAKFLYAFMAKHNSIQNFFFRSFFSAAFNHHDSFFGTGNSYIHSRCFHLFLSRVDDVFTVDFAYSDTCNRSIPRNIRNAQGNGCAKHTAKFRRIIIINREYSRNYMHIIAASFIKKRTNRAVDQACVQNRRISWSSFSAQESSRHFTYSIHLFFIVYSQREEICSFTRFFASCRSYEYDCITIAN